MSLFFEIVNLVDLKGKDSKEKTKRAIALGMFDGVHLGHQAIFQAVLNFAKQENIIPCAITFREPPIKWTSPSTKIELITTLEERLEVFKHFGIQQAIVLDFAALSKLAAEDYLNKVLKEMLQASFLAFGPNHFFGKDKTGNTKMLIEWAKQNNVGCKLVQIEEMQSGEAISSSLIRNLLKEGKVKEANKFLGYNYLVFDKVVPGSQLGRKLGFPTFNFRYSPNKVPLKYGVYAARTKIKEKFYASAVNFGLAPTTRLDNDPFLESHLLEDIVGDLPPSGESLQVELLEFIRPEQKFASLDQLKAQIGADCQQIIDLLKQAN